MATKFSEAARTIRNGTAAHRLLFAGAFSPSFFPVCCRFTTAVSELARQRGRNGNCQLQRHQRYRCRYLTACQTETGRTLTMANRAVEFNGDEDEDEALRMAIAMSLGQEPGERKGVIDLTGDGDDDTAVVSGGGGGGQVKASAPEPERPAPSASSSGFFALGVDRKQMEAERLARLSKRKASQLDDRPTAQDRPTRRARISATPPPAQTAPSSMTQKALPTTTTTSSSASSTTAPSTPRLPFPHGVVKRTWAFGQPRHADDIRLEDVLQKSRLELAVLSSFQWDEEWLFSKIDVARTKVVLVAFAVDEKQVSFLRRLGY